MYIRKHYLEGRNHRLKKVYVMKTPKVSVIMPAYNTEKYVGEAIESILNQTFTDFEFIILNDGSTDNTAKIVKEYAKEDKRIKFIDNKKNQGFIASLNQCLDVANGEYIAKMDSDDVSLPDRLEKQVKYLDDFPNVGLVGCGYKTFDKTEFEVINPANVGMLDLLKGCYTTIFMLRKKIINDNNLRFRKEYIHAEDYDFYARFRKFAPIENIQQVLYLYRWHGDNVSIKQSNIQRQNSEKVRRDILDFLTTNYDVQNKIDNIINAQTKTIVYKYYLFGFIPIMRKKQIGNKTKYYLFNCILILKIKK